MDKKYINLIERYVHHYYWEENLNCTRTTLKVLSKLFSLNINEQVMISALGLHGAGGYQAQCGLVEGALLFMAIYGWERGVKEKEIVQICFQFASKFEREFGSLSCKVLRPEGFNASNPPHLCEELTKKALSFIVHFIEEYFSIV